MRIGVSMAVLALAAQAAGAQEPVSLPVTDAATATQLLRIVASARERGLPTDKIISKLSFAALKHAPPGKMVEIATATASRLQVARDALGPDPVNDIGAGEEALANGVNQKLLRELREMSPRRALAVPLGVLAQLVASGVPVTRASKTVVDLIRRGAEDKMLVALGNDVTEDIAHGDAAEASLNMRTNFLNAVLPGTAAGAANSAAFNAPAAVPPKKP